MRPPVSRNDAEKWTIQIVVEKHHFFGGLDDLVGRPDARHAGRLAPKRRVELHLVVVELFDLRQKFGLVVREVSRWRGSASAAASGAASAPASSRGGSRRKKTRTVRHADRAVRQLHRCSSATTTLRNPRPIEVGPAIR